MEMKKLLESFNHAINGIIDAVRTQRNMKIHIVAAIGVLIACFFFDISKAEFLSLEEPHPASPIVIIPKTAITITKSTTV